MPTERLRKPLNRPLTVTTDAARSRWLLLSPALAVYSLLALLPIANLIAMSLHVIKYDQGIAHWTFNGLAHYATMPADQAATLWLGLNSPLSRSSGSQPVH